MGGNPIIWVDPFGLTQCRHTPRRGWRCTGDPGSGGRVGVFGCIIGCVSYTQGDRAAKASIESTVGGGLMVCSPKKDDEPKQCDTEPKKDCGMYDPNCDNSVGVGVSIPGRGNLGKSGAVIGMQKNSDGSKCVLIGLFGGTSVVSGSIQLGDIDE